MRWEPRKCLYRVSQLDYWSGDILDARDNALAAANKFATEDILFELSTHKKAIFSDLYLIHQVRHRSDRRQDLSNSVAA